MKAQTFHMTEGSPVRLLTVFAAPLLVGNLFQQVYNLADSIIVGKLIGADALAAVGATGSVSFLFFSLCNGIGSGGGIVVSRYFGAGDEENVRKSVANAAYIMFGSSVLMSVIAYLAAPSVLRLTGIPSDIWEDTVVYMHISCAGVPFIAVYNYAASILRALGDSRTPLYFLVFACFLNIGLDILAVYCLGLGVFGAGLATIIGQFTAGIGCLLYAIRTTPCFRLERRHFRLEKKILWGTIRMGIPLAMQYSLVSISCLAMQRVVNSFGSTAIAAFTATSRVEQLVHNPYGSLGAALTTYSGQNLGANRMDRVKLGFRKGVYLGSAFSLVMFPIMQLFSENIMHIFVEDPAVIELGAAALKITSWFYFALGLIYLTRGVLNGVGDALFAFINGIVEMAGRIILPPLLILIPSVGIYGIWWAAGLTWFLSAFFCLLRYFAWRRHGEAQQIAF